jgi:hypothetical protein
MEFDKDAPVSDEQRRLAEAKKITLQPVHSNIAPEVISDSEIAARHVNGQPIGNTDNDTEQNMPLIKPAHNPSGSQSPNPNIKKQALGFALIALATAGLVIAIGFYIAPQ